MNLRFVGIGVFVYSDPAGGNTVLSIIESLILNGQINGRDFFVFSNNSTRLPLDSFPFVEIIEHHKKKAISQILDEINPDYLFSATSNNSFEHEFRVSAKSKGIYTYSYIDHWTSYLKRFSFNDEIEFGNEVLVINDIAKFEAVEEGVPRDLIRVVGNPFNDLVSNFKPSQDRSNFIKYLGTNPNKRIILFVSDNIKASFPSDENGDCSLGFDEFSILNIFLKSIKEIGNEINLNDYQLIIKIHPMSEEGKFDEILLKYKGLGVDITVIKDCDSLTLNYYSWLVIGMFSNMVAESLLMGKNVIRVQIGQKTADLFKFDKIRSIVITDLQLLNSKLKEILR